MVMRLAALPDERAALDPGGPCLADGRRELDNASFASEVRRKIHHHLSLRLTERMSLIVGARCALPHLVSGSLVANAADTHRLIGAGNGRTTDGFRLSSRG